MNIYHLHYDPIKSADWVCDQDITDQIQTCCSIISTCLIKRYGVSSPHLHRASYLNHPLNIWLQESIANLEWVMHYLGELHDIGSRLKLHSTMLRHAYSIYEECYYVVDSEPTELPTEFPLLVPDRHKQSFYSPYDVYCNYYHDKHSTSTTVTYKSRKVPAFMRDVISSRYSIGMYK